MCFRTRGSGACVPSFGVGGVKTPVDSLIGSRLGTCSWQPPQQQRQRQRVCACLVGGRKVRFAAATQPSCAPSLPVYSKGSVAGSAALAGGTTSARHFVLASSSRWQLLGLQQAQRLQPVIRAVTLLARLPQCDTLQRLGVHRTGIIVCGVFWLLSVCGVCRSVQEPEAGVFVCLPAGANNVRVVPAK